MTDKSAPSNDPLHALLRTARPNPPLPPQFQAAVWRRIEAAQTTHGAEPLVRWLERVAAWLLRPRQALAGLAVLLLVGASIGVVQGNDLADELAKQRYLAAVSPFADR